MTHKDPDEIPGGPDPDKTVPAKPPAVPGLPPRLDEFIDDAEDEMHGYIDGTYQPVPLPWDTVAEPLGGGFRKGMHILIGNTKSGKTQFALQAALHATAHGVPLLYFALELPRDQFFARLAAIHSKDSGLYFGDFAKIPKPPRTPEKVKSVLANAKKAIRHRPIYAHTLQDPTWVYQTLEGAAEEIRKRHNVAPFIVVDYMQIVAKTNEHQEMRLHITDLARELKRVASGLKTAALVLSSTARSHYSTLAGRKALAKKDDEKFIPGESPPEELVGAGMESNGIEFNADSVLVMCREHGKKDVRHLAIAAQRNGDIGWIKLSYDGVGFHEPEPGRGMGSPPAQNSTEQLSGPLAFERPKV